MPKKTATRPVQGDHASPAVNLDTLYTGGDPAHAVDGSNRVMLPSAWRRDGTPAEFVVMFIPDPDHLVVWPPAEFAKFLAGIRAKTDEALLPDVERELTAQVREVCLDGVGRLPVPSDLLAKAGIGKQGKLVGRFAKFELWSPEKYQAAEAVRQESVAKAGLREKLRIV